jgi:hypothetical protein
MIEMDNEMRAARAHDAVLAYLDWSSTPGKDERFRLLEGEPEEAWDEVIRDLVTDLGHLYYREVHAVDSAYLYDDALGQAHDAFIDEAYQDPDPTQEDESVDPERRVR